MNVEKTAPEPLHRILREVYRHYPEFKQYVSDTGKHVIDHSYPFIDEAGDYGPPGEVHKHNVTISFYDLQKGLDSLAPRKRQAFWLNVIEDKKQKDVAEIMDITTVSVGQYVEQAMLQLARDHFAEGANIE